MTTDSTAANPKRTKVSPPKTESINKIVDATSGKIRRPHLPAIATRTRLFGCFDDAFRQSPALWIEGPPGAGKTTAIASYLHERSLATAWMQVDEGDADPATFFHFLGAAVQPHLDPQVKLPQLTPEYFGGMAQFVRNYFDRIAAATRVPLTLVLDNYQELAELTVIHSLLADVLDRLPSNVRLAFVSRTAPLTPFARAQINRTLNLVTEPQLRLTEDEAFSVAQLRVGTLTKTHAQRIESLRTATQGWVAGLILALERSELAQSQSSLDTSNRKLLFEYFAAEIFNRTDAIAQHVLLTASVMPFITREVAAELSGSLQAGDILDQLHRKNYFVSYRDEDGAYLFHPLFQDFLSAQLRTKRSDQQLIALWHHGALLLEKSGRLEEAIELYRRAADLASQVRLILGLAPQLVVQGRFRVLDSWINALPKEVSEHTSWLQYWLGACRTPFDAQASYAVFARAFAMFGSEKNLVGQLLSCSGAIDSILLQWGEFGDMDGWIDWLNGLPATVHEQLPPTIQGRVSASMMCALIMRRPYQANIQEWIDKALKLAAQDEFKGSQSAAIFLGVSFYGTMGNFAPLSTTLEYLKKPKQQQPQVLTAIAQCYMEATDLWIHGKFEPALHHATQGLRLADESGVHVWDYHLLTGSMYITMSMGDLPKAGQLLARYSAIRDPSKPHLHSPHRYLQSWYALAGGDTHAAIEHAQEILDSAVRTGKPLAQIVCHQGLAQACFAAGQIERANRELACGRTLAATMCTPQYEYSYDLIAARFALDSGNELAAVEMLRATLPIGRERGFSFRDGWLIEPMTRLYVCALKHGVETAHVQQLIRQAPAAFSAPPVQLDEWPWPIKVHALGRFTVFLDGKPIRFSTKAQKKPLELLKALLALGGKQVREDKAAEALWPDAEADDAARSLTSTIHRLRALIGEESIDRQQGLLTLNPARCWTDLWAVQRVMTQLDTACNERDVERIAELTQATIKLYGGGFLDGDSDASWALGMRERMRAKVLRQLETAAKRLLESDRQELAIDGYQRALEIDPLAEGLYSGLMQSYLSLHRHADALLAYDRCCDLLRRDLGVKPSPEIERLKQRAYADVAP